MARFLEINDTVASSRFDVGKAKSAYAEFIFMGACGPCLRHQASSVNAGVAEFFWDRNARALEPGWYHVTLFTDGCPCKDFPLRVSAPCSAEWLGDTERDACSDCDSLPTAPARNCSVPLKPKKCETEICPTEDKRPAVYVPNYEV